MDLRAGAAHPPRARGLRLAEHVAAAARRRARGRARERRARAPRPRRAGRLPPPVFQPPPPEPRTRGGGDRDPPVVRRIERDPRTADAGRHGLRLHVRRPRSRREIEERYDGVVGVSTDDPGNAWVRATSALLASRGRRRRWRPRRGSTSARTRGSYHVVVDVIAEEDGDDGIGRIERRFEREIPRRLQ